MKKMDFNSQPLFEPRKKVAAIGTEGLNEVFRQIKWELEYAAQFSANSETRLYHNALAMGGIHTLQILTGLSGEVLFDHLKVVKL